MIQGRVDAVRRAAVHVQNKGTEGDSIYECSKQHFIFKPLAISFFITVVEFTEIFSQGHEIKNLHCHHAFDQILL